MRSILPLVAVSAGALGAATGCMAMSPTPQQPGLGNRTAPILHVEGLAFRDLDRNGKLDRYEDWRLTPEQRADDLITRMTLPEKAGTMLHSVARGARGKGANGGGSSTGYDLVDAKRVIVEKHINSVLTRITVMPKILAEQNNALQEIAETGRLGIPMTISTDPRSNFESQAGASTRNMGFSQWPGSLGFGAIGDASLMRRFGEIVGSEYRAAGITMALSPQADVASDPRWGRFTGTFGSDPETVAKLTGAYVIGFQGGPNGVTPKGVFAVVKHWVGYGAQAEGLDSHNYYGRFNVIRADSLPLHLKPFEAAFAAHVEAVMPTYSIPRELTIDGKPVAQVGAAFNKDLLTTLLRDKYHFNGLVVSDWRVTHDCLEQCVNGAKAGEKIYDGQFGMPWGVSDLSVSQRFAKAIAAGVDSFGGVDTTDELVDAITRNDIPMARIDQAVRRILIPKFRQGLFENPYVDPAATEAYVGNPGLMAEGERAQARATVLLKNDHVLPLAPSVRKIWAYGVPDAAIRAAGFEPVTDPAQADVAIVRTTTPFENQHPNYQFGNIHHEGDLDYKPGNPDRQALERAAASGKPTVLAIMLDRPAILTELAPNAAAILANFGISDKMLFCVLTGKAQPEGKLPFSLPRSMESVRAQRSDIPNDERDPLFPAGFGLRFGSR